jgi:Icc-related predicted phosphoesterase
MKIFYFSDIHDEIRQKSWNMMKCDGVRALSDETVVVAAGDIHEHERIASFLRSNFPKNRVIFVPGNDEYCSFSKKSMDEIRETMRKQCKKHDIIMLDDEEVFLDGVRFLGSTLWTDFCSLGRDRMIDVIRESVRCLRDYRLISTENSFITASHILHLNAKAVLWLSKKLTENNDAKTVVVTHYAPLKICVDEHARKNLLTASFVCDLPDLVELSNLWIHGHSHESSYLRHGKCSVISNRCAYDNKRTGANRFFFEIVEV